MADSSWGGASAWQGAPKPSKPHQVRVQSREEGSKQSPRVSDGLGCGGGAQVSDVLGSGSGHSVECVEWGVVVGHAALGPGFLPLTAASPEG